MAFVPLFGPVPGGMELLVIFFVFVLVFGVPLGFVVASLAGYRSATGDGVSEADIEDLKREVADLRATIEDERREFARDGDGDRHRDHNDRD